MVRILSGGTVYTFIYSWIYYRRYKTGYRYTKGLCAIKVAQYYIYVFPIMNYRYLSSKYGEEIREFLAISAGNTVCLAEFYFHRTSSDAIALEMQSESVRKCCSLNIVNSTYILLFQLFMRKNFNQISFKVFEGIYIYIISYCTKVSIR